jgi:hypothetical protein
MREMSDDPENSGRDHGGRFQKGVSGNPFGKPRGARHKATLAAEAMLRGGLDDAVGVIIRASGMGDVEAAKFIVSRIIPAAKDKTIQLELKKIKTASDAVEAMSEIVGEMAAGEITPDEATAACAPIEKISKAIEISELEARVAALEGKSNADD